MKCPNCNTTMEEGQLHLKAWGLGIAPQAQLHFDDDLVLKTSIILWLDSYERGPR